VRSAFQIRGSWDEGKVTTTFTHKKNNFGRKENDFSLEVVFSSERVEIQRLSKAIPNPDKEPTKREQIREAVEELGRATAEDVATKTGIDLKTVQNAFSTLIKADELVASGEKKNRFRIVIPHSQSTKGRGT
jgi:predicted HTH transcriptional regulator